MTALRKPYTVSDISQFDLIDFIIDLGWKVTKTENNKWIKLLCISNENKQFELILQNDPLGTQSEIYFQNVLDSISVILNIDHQELINRIIFRYYDILRMRNLETDGLNSIPLRTAALQVQELKQFVAYAACSEENQKPFFINSQLSTAKKIISEYQFGHTFQGSFGFMVQTPKIYKNQFSRYESLVPDLVSDSETIPIYRRVMERIAFGLFVTKEAKSNYDQEILISNYKHGFNANMCQALINMSSSGKIPLEYSIIWSTKISPFNENIKDSTGILLDEIHYEYLEYAANKLSELEIDDTTIHGLITELKTNDNPLGYDTSRTIIVRWINEETGKLYNVFVELSKADYLKAIDAHQNWIPISITGKLSRIKSHWRLVNYYDFKTY